MKTRILLLLACIGLSACGTLDKSGVYAGDQVLYQVDVVVPATFDVFQTFVKWEYDNRAALASQPDVKKAADYIRANAPQWKRSIVALRASYAADPNPANRKSLTDLLAVLQTAVAEASKYLVPKPPATS